MEYLKIDGEFPRLSPSAVTLGKFDGIHRGHMQLVKRVLMQKEQFGLKAVLFAIDVNEKMILSRNERAALLEKMGIDFLIECPLNETFKNTKAESFVREMLVGDFHAAYVTVGEDYRFGSGRKGTPELLKTFGKKYGFQTEIVTKEMDGHRKVSSTFIREELRKGNMEKVAALLGREYFLDGTVAHGRGLGHKKLLPTANIIPAGDKLMPPNGVYVTRSHFEGKVCGGITNVGYKPTIGENFIGAETYLFDYEGNLYGESCRIEFLRYIRPEYKFSSLEALKSRLLEDARIGREYLHQRSTVE